MNLPSRAAGASVQAMLSKPSFVRRSVFLLAAVWGGWASAWQPAAASPQAGVINFTRLWVDEAGRTRLKRCQLPGLEKKGSFGTTQYVRDLVGSVAPADLVFTQQLGDNPWHPCPSPQFVVTLAGAWYINTTDGDYIEFNAGDLLYQDDSKGLIVSGVEPVHYSGTIGGPCNQLVISVSRSPAPGSDSCDWPSLVVE
mmetsp:Transcript_46751/g.109051  ORF Transcript_46751/g.109051 Transcript_46751/m.109051 type:complete len:197 (+) Transcript_46751:32-622(+)